jgi:cobaltochelatase CobN
VNLKDREAINMRIICIDCQFSYTLWQNEVMPVSSGCFNKKEFETELDALADDIINGNFRTVVLYTMHLMEFRFGGFLNKIKDKALLIPIGAEAISLGFANAEPEHIAAVNRYVLFGGNANIIALEKYIAAEITRESSAEAPEPPAEMPFFGLFSFDSDAVYPSLDDYLSAKKPAFEHYAGVFTHRYAWINGSLAATKTMCESLERRGIGAIPVFSSNDENSPEFAELVEKCFFLDGKVYIQALVNLNMFAIKAKDGRSVSEQSIVEYAALGVPVFAPVQSHYLTEEDWRNNNNPLAEDMPSALILPETHGMIEPVIISVNDKNGKAVALKERVEYAARRIASWIRLRTTPNRDKKIALVLHNSVCSGVEATIGRAFGLDALESAVRIMRRLFDEGYTVTDIPERGADLLKLLMEKKAFSDFRWTSVEDIVGSGGCIYEMPVKGEYEGYYNKIPASSRKYMEQVWGAPPGEGMTLNNKLIITGLQFGNVLVMVQPKRGCYGAKCTGEVCKILHDPACPPPHQYLASYRFLQNVFKADAVIDIGTDGSAEYLPGKASGLCEACWPSIVLDSLPSLYLYNTGVISEAMIAKRRMNSVIVDYLPAASMGVDEKTSALSRLIDDYNNSQLLDNGQAQVLKSRIEKLVEELPLVKGMVDSDFDSSLAQVRDRIRAADKARQIFLEQHIFGLNPSEEEIRRFVREVWQSEGIDASVPLVGSDFDEIKSSLLNTNQEMDNLISALSGVYVPAGESGMPDENGRSIIPTGRNMYGMQIDKVPSKTAWERGVELAEQLLEQYRRDEGRLPEQIAMNMISLDVTKAGGEQLSQFLYLIGAAPIWDKQGRVSGLRVIPLAELNRARIDVTVRISGVLRDTWPSIVLMMDDAVMMIAGLNESECQNYVLKHIREYIETFDIGSAEAAEAQIHRPIRVFGDPPGAYGAGIDLALLASAWKDEDDLVKYFTQSSAFAYGKGLDGARKVREFIDTARKVEVSTDITQSRRMNIASCAFGTQIQGGYRLLAKRLGGRTIRQYQSISERGVKPKTETLAENLKRAVEDTILNEFWREGIRRKGYDGAADIMHVVQNTFSAQVTTECLDDSFLNRITEETINNDEFRDWLEHTNPYALEEIGRRLLELESRGKWKADAKVLERLKQNYLIIEGDMEGRLEPKGDIQGGSINTVNHQGIALWEAQLRDIEVELTGIEKKPRQ